MRNRYHLIFVFFLSLRLFHSCGSSAPPLPPNIIYVMVDDLGSADLGCYGSKDILTPNIDQFAQEGLVFRQAYSGNTVCAPARSTLMTGLHSGNTQVRGNTGGIALPDSAFTVAELLQQAGYVTGGFGKWGLGDQGTEGVPEKQGFDEFFGYYHQIHAHNYYPEYLWRNSEKVKLPAEEGQANSYTQYRIFDKMKAFIQTHKDEAFFCYAPWPVPHGKYVIPSTDPTVSLYQEKDWTEKRKNYAAMTSLFDRQFGELMTLLKELEIDERTLVIFCSDNGGGIEFADEKTNGELRGFKRDLYEGGIRIPFIARWPGKINPGRTTNEQIYFPDILPTFAEVAGQKNSIPRNIDGISLYKLLTDANHALPNRMLYWEYPHYDWRAKNYPDNQFKQAIRYKNWKMIRNGKDQEWEFYDLREDPLETDNVEAYHPGKMEKFQEWITEHRKEAPPQIEPDQQEGRSFR